MSRLITVLVVAIVVLVGAVAYLIGQKNGGPDQSASKVAAAGPNTATAVPKGSSPPKSPAITRVSQSVIVGLDGPSLDACGSNARVVGPNGKGDNFLAVKTAPRIDAPRIDKLGPGFEVYVCQESKDHKWLGVVYEPDGQPSANCGVTGPVAFPQPYAGRCQSGWVYSKYIDVYAG